MAIWTQEFDGPVGSAPDPSAWIAELGGGGWGDDQLQSYTRPPANAYLTGSGQLAIVAREDPDVPGGISSARLTTHGLVSFRYGRIAARIKVPSTAGTWPAFWMLGTDIDTVGWPACGEIDVMEHVGSDPTAVHGTVHGTGYAGIGHGVATGSIPVRLSRTTSIPTPSTGYRDPSAGASTGRSTSASHPSTFLDRGPLRNPSSS